MAIDDALDALIEEIANEIAEEYTEAGADEISGMAGNAGQESYFNDDLVPTFVDLAPDMMLGSEDEPPDYVGYCDEMNNSCPDGSAASGASMTIDTGFEYIQEAWEIINDLRQAGGLL